MSVFFTDTDCEMDFKTAEELKVNVIGMPYTIKGQEKVYDYGKNTDFKEFYNLMRSGEVATTSALNKDDYISYFEPVFARGEDIFYIHLECKKDKIFH